MFAMFMKGGLKGGLKGGFIAMAVPSSVFTTVEFEITYVTVFGTASLAPSPFVLQVGCGALGFLCSWWARGRALVGW